MLKLEIAQAIKENDINKVKTLLEQGQDPNQVDKILGNRSLLMLACHTGNIEMALLLLQHGANVHFVCAQKESAHTALQIACRAGNIELVKVLLDYGADANEKIKIIQDPEENKKIQAKVDAFGKELIEMAYPSLRVDLNQVHEEQVEWTAKMLGRYPDRYMTPLLNAVLAGNAQVVELLLSQGAEVDLMDGYSHTALHNASWKGLIDIVKVLIKYGAQVNLRTQFGETPLYLVCSAGSDLSNKQGRIAVVKYLLEHGANVEIGMEYGDGLLYELYDQEYKPDDIEIIKLLIQHGAKVSEWAIEYFTEHGYQDVLDLIEKREKSIWQTLFSFITLKMQVKK